MPSPPSPSSCRMPFIGFNQKFNAEKSIAALKKMTAPLAKVRRAGKVTSIPASEIVAGDIIELEAGDVVARGGYGREHASSAKTGFLGTRPCVGFAWHRRLIQDSLTVRTNLSAYASFLSDKLHTCTESWIVKVSHLRAVWNCPCELLLVCPRG
jgi:hypothetical protein